MDEYYHLLQDLLKQRRAEGQTNQQMADVADTSHQHINRLLNGKPEQFGKVKLETLLRLFPSFFAPCLSGGVKTTLTNSNGNAIANNGTAIVSPQDDLLKKEQLVTAILNDDGICDACKVRVLKLLQNSAGYTK